MHAESSRSGIELVPCTGGWIATVDYQGSPRLLISTADDLRISFGVVAVMWKFDLVEPRGTSY